MAKSVLITGGAGFIGSHVADELLAAGWSVRALDCLSEQVHGPGKRRPEYLDDAVELVIGDVRDPAVLREALSGVDAVLHLAAAVGVGQSMYEVANYTSVNALGTAVLLEALTQHEVGALVVASSMSVYGEGRYLDRGGVAHDEVGRELADIEGGRWDPIGPDGSALVPVPTPETKRVCPTSIYALNKYDQEQMCLVAGRAYRRPTVALRLFNTYGPRQALSNPYTGVLANFATRLLNGNPPLVFEDGLQKRDFVSVHDVARAFRLALEQAAAVDGEVFNIGSGVPHDIRTVAALVARVLGREIAPEITGKYRVGDIRHCYADVGKAKALLGYAPQVTLEAGVAELGQWLAGRQAEDRMEAMRAELERRGLQL